MADDILSALTENESEAEDTVLFINPEDRTITIPTNFIFGVYNDKDVLTIPFSIPRYYGDIDLSDFRFTINYLNAAGYGNIFDVTDLEVKRDVINFTWTLGRAVFVSRGSVKFVVCIRRIGTNGRIIQELNTRIYSAEVLAGLEVEETPDPEVYSILANMRELEASVTSSRAFVSDTAAQIAITVGYATIAVSEANRKLDEADAAITRVEGMFGSPLVAATAASMTDTTRVYVYTGSETGYTNGNWYYYDGSAWTSGGAYNSQGINTDTSLTITGMAADAKKTGDEISGLKSELSELKQPTKNLFDKSAFDNVSGITLGQDGYYQGTVNAFRDAFSSLFPIDGVYKLNTRYTVSCNYYFTDVTGTYTGPALTFKVVYTDETTGNLFNLVASNSSAVTGSATTALSKTVDYLILARSDSRAANYVLHIKDVQIEEGTTPTSYVEHFTANDITKIQNEQGAENAGKLLIVNENGIVEPQDNPISIDATLSVSGDAADSKATGDKISSVLNALNTGIITTKITLAKTDFKQGGWGDTGVANSNTDRIGANLGYLPSGTVINYDLYTGHRLGVKVFQKEVGSSSNTKLSGTTSWQTGSNSYTTLDSGYVTVEVQVSSGTISVNDYAETIYFNKGSIPEWISDLQSEVSGAVNTVSEIEAVVDDKLLPEKIINPTYKFIKLPEVAAWSTTFQNFFEIGNEIWFCTASTEFGGDTHNGIVFRVNKSDWSYIGKFNHNLGHMAQLDYDAETDRIMLCNTESSSEPKIYIFHDVSDWSSIISNNPDGHLVTSDLTYDTIDLADLRTAHMSLLYAITCWAERQPDGNRLVVGEGSHGAQWFKLMLGMGANDLGEGTYSAAESGRFNGSYKTLWYKTCQFTEIPGRDTPQANQGLICYNGRFYEGLGHQPSYGGIYTPMVSDYVHRDIFNLQMFLPDGNVYGGQSNTGGVSEGINIINGKLCVGIAGYSDETYLVMMDI